MFKSPECGFADYFVEQNFNKYVCVIERKDFKAVGAHRNEVFQLNNEIIHVTGLNLPWN